MWRSSIVTSRKHALRTSCSHIRSRRGRSHSCRWRRGGPPSSSGALRALCCWQQHRALQKMLQLYSTPSRTRQIDAAQRMLSPSRDSWRTQPNSSWVFRTSNLMKKICSYIFHTNTVHNHFKFHGSRAAESADARARRLRRPHQERTSAASLELQASDSYSGLQTPDSGLRTPDSDSAMGLQSRARCFAYSYWLATGWPAPW